jgi:glutamate synthase (NADPH/NADH) small chain
LTTDNGSAGRKGFVTDPLREMLEAGEKIDLVLAIGPVIMMKNVAATTKPFGVKTTASLNTIMVDGTGMCGGCRVMVGGENKFACVDGPEFDAHEVDFANLVMRQQMYKDQEALEYSFAEAYKILKQKSTLPAVCGRVCPQENQCEGKCVLGIKGEPVAIGRLERFVADYAREHGLDNDVEAPAERKGKKVAVVGSGPSGLTCAGDLAKMGYDVTMYEALHAAGGVLMYGIPQFRLPKEIVQHEISALKKLGVKIVVDAVIGRTFTIKELMEEEGFSAVYVGTGAGLPHFMQIDGENLNGVYSANEFLTRVNLMKAYEFPNYATPVYVGKKAAIVGAGNVAMDAARTAKRLGAEQVYIVYRRSEEEMPARKEEIGHAKEEGIELRLLNNPVAILGDEKGWVNGLKCIKMELGEADASGRRSPVAIAGSEYVLDVDMVVMAIGQGPNPLIKQTTPDLEVNKRGNIVADEAGATSIPGVFAGGDIVTGAATVISAMGAGKKAAAAIDEYLSK